MLRIVAVLVAISMWAAGIAAINGCSAPPANPAGKAEPRQPLVIYCAASNKSVLETILADYEREFGVRHQIEFGASQTLLASLEIAGEGDLYLPADESYLDLARERKLVAEQYPLATMQPVIAVAKGNPKQIKQFTDLLRTDVTIAQANPDAAAIGKLTRDALTAIGQWEKLHAKTTVYKTNVNEVANDVKIGAVDAGIVYDAVLHDYPSLEAVSLPELAGVKARVAIALLNASQQPRPAKHLARYIAARDKGLVRYREFGFEPVEGEAFSLDDARQDRP
jgi:molybdate transport system substrate-binding protein